METQKIVNSLTLIVSLQNLQQRIGTLLMTKITQNMVKEIETTQALNSREKLLNKILVIIQMHIFL